MIWTISKGQQLDLTFGSFETRGQHFAGLTEFRGDRGTHYGYAFRETAIETPFGSFTLQPGMYFRVPGPFSILYGIGIVITRIGEGSIFQIGGPIERHGRLRYIDGCTDTLLISPLRAGDACLNHLHFPVGIKQTMHTHPSVRVGIVAKGQGRCITPEGEFPLVPGTCWYLPVDGKHCFYTDDHTMDIIAWHPDSDTGPRDQDHPMINRTIVDGTSARYLDAIATKDIRE